ncbi:uncharacterized protein LAJ45_05601 [Morchella importuna]|uniref:uncharacterized protein n=1 Tax=Morchella importuna TaxID=1174673 RepID=UPI001E8EE351|nr:uncharacterized protein LAJ45_05601 [Morchella importuna]KAH8150390.1 hypothetical protein LAJ45_05601 [Morchella importuna]
MNQEAPRENHPSPNTPHPNAHPNEIFYPQGCYDPHEKVLQKNFLEELTLGIATKDIKRIRFALDNKLDSTFSCKIYADDNPSSVWAVGVHDPSDAYLTNMSGWIHENCEKIIFHTYGCKIPTLHLLLKLWSPHIAKHFQTAVGSSSNSTLNGKDEEGATPLIKAAQCSIADAVKLLLGFGADPNQRCNKGFNALEHSLYASKKIERRETEGLEDSHSVIHLLLDSCIEMGYRDHKGRSLFHLAVKYGHSSLIGFLAGKERESMDCPDNGDQTPLELAVRLGDLDSVCSLVDSAAETKIREHFNDDGYDHSEYFTLFKNVVELLERKGPSAIYKILHTECTRYHFKLSKGSLETALRAQPAHRNPASIQIHNPKSIPPSRVERKQHHFSRPLSIPMVNQSQDDDPQSVSGVDQSKDKDLQSVSDVNQSQDKDPQSISGVDQSRGNDPQPISGVYQSQNLHLQVGLESKFQRDLRTFQQKSLASTPIDMRYYLKTAFDANTQEYFEDLAARSVCFCSDSITRAGFFHSVTMFFCPWDSEDRKRSYDRLKTIFHNYYLECQDRIYLHGPSSCPQSDFYTPPFGVIDNALIRRQGILRKGILLKDQEDLEIAIASSCDHYDSISRQGYFKSAALFFHPWEHKKQEDCRERLEQLFQFTQSPYHDGPHGPALQHPHESVSHIPDDDHRPQLDTRPDEHQPSVIAISDHQSESDGNERRIKQEFKLEPQTEVQDYESEGGLEVKCEKKSTATGRRGGSQDGDGPGRSDNREQDQSPSSNNQKLQSKRRHSKENKEKKANKRQKRRLLGGDKEVKVNKSQKRPQDLGVQKQERNDGKKVGTWSNRACGQGGNTQNLSRKRKGTADVEEKQIISAKRSKN